MDERVSPRRSHRSGLGHWDAARPFAPSSEQSNRFRINGFVGAATPNARRFSDVFFAEDCAFSRRRTLDHVSVTISDSGLRRCSARSVPRSSLEGEPSRQCRRSDSSEKVQEIGKRFAFTSPSVVEVVERSWSDARVVFTETRNSLARSRLTRAAWGAARYYSPWDRSRFYAQPSPFTSAARSRRGNPVPFDSALLRGSRFPFEPLAID